MAVSSERVETPESMRAALETQAWDVILCDFSMPHFTALQALALLHELELDTPFIISGTVGEDVAVEAMRAGAHDYLIQWRRQIVTTLRPGLCGFRYSC
jgi:DNA-binding NtrC family response regulator